MSPVVGPVDFGEYTALLRAATPEHWYLSDLAMDRSWSPLEGHPATTFSVRATTGRSAGKRVMRHVNGESRVDVPRRIEVVIKAPSIESLARAVEDTLVGLEAILSLPIDTELSLSMFDL